MENFLTRSRIFILENPILIAFISLAVLLRIIFWLYTGRVWEDALITLAPAKNFWLGHGLTHHMSEPRVHSFTSPISVLIPLIGEAFGQGLVLLRLVSLVAAAATIYYAYKIGLILKFHWVAQIFFLSYLATDQLQIFFGMSGMETQIATAIFLGNIYYLFRQKWKLLGIFAGLGLLVRPEFVFWIPVFGVYLLIWHPKQILSVLIPFLCITVPWYLFAYLYYGSIIPNTMLAKSLGGNLTPFWAPFSDMLEFFLFSWKIIAPFEQWLFIDKAPIPLFFIKLSVGIVIGLFILGFVKAWKQRNRELIAISLIVLIFIIYLNSTLTYVYFLWYIPPFAALLFLVAAYGLSNLATYQRHLAIGLGCFTALMYALHIPFSFPVEKVIQEKIECGVRLKTGRILNDLMGPSDNVVLEPLGYIGHGAFNKTTHDFPGLSSTFVVKTMKHVYDNKIIILDVATLLAAQIIELKPSFLVLRPHESHYLSDTHSEIATNYKEVAHIYVLSADIALTKWGYSSKKNLWDSDFKIFQRIMPPTELGEQKPIELITKTYSFCP